MFIISNCCTKYQNFTLIPGMEILWKRTVSTDFRAIVPKLCKNCALLQNFHSRNLREISVFYAVKIKGLSRFSNKIKAHDIRTHVKLVLVTFRYFNLLNNEEGLYTLWKLLSCCENFTLVWLYNSHNCTQL